jgi:hypothetical protein
VRPHRFALRRHAVPIQLSAVIQTAVRVVANRLARIPAQGFPTRAGLRAGFAANRVRFWLYCLPRSLTGAGIEELAGIGAHRLQFGGSAMRTGDDGFQDHYILLKHVADVGGSCRIGKHRGFEIVYGQVVTRRKVPFLFVTGYGSENLPISFRNVSVLSKPFSQSQLLEAAARLVQQDSSVVRLRQ